MNRFIYAVAAVCGLYLGGAAFAQSIPKVDFANMPVGTVVSYQEANGDDRASIYVGLVDGLHIMEYRQGADAAGSLVSRTGFDAEGRMMFWEGDGAKWAFSPHGCDRVVGSCDYKSKNTSTGKSYRNTRRASVGVDGTVSWTRFYKGQISATGKYKPSAEAFGLNEEWSFSPSRGKSRSGRITGVTTP